MTVPLLLLTLGTCGFAIAASVCAVLLKRELETWWRQNYAMKSARVMTGKATPRNQASVQTAWNTADGGQS